MGKFSQLVEDGQGLAEQPTYNGVQNFGGPVDPISSLDVNVPVVTEPYHTAVVRANANLSTAVMYMHQAGQFAEAAAKAMAGLSSDTKDELVELALDASRLHKKALDLVYKVTRDR